MLPPEGLYVLAGIVGRTLAVYLALVVGIRLAGKGELGQLTPFDLVTLITLSNAVQNAMTGPDTSVAGGIVAAGTLLLANFLISRLGLGNVKFRRLIEGAPTVLVSNGRVIEDSLRKERLTIDELAAAVREHGALRVEDIALAVLEVDGNISVIRFEDLHPDHQVRHRWRHGARKP